ncbi:MAG: arginine--tRNA ligase [Spirochaetaceae bacterium]
MDMERVFWKEKVRDALKAYAAEIGAEADAISGETVIPEVPPKPEMGDIAFPMFPFAKVFKRSPAEIAGEIGRRLGESIETADRGSALPAGPYLNIKVKMEDTAKITLERITREEESYGRGDALSGRRITIEFSCPNTNKPLHLGHLRNDSIGESVARILKANGAEVRKVNLINDRGIHICKSMLAYRKFGHGETPESTGKKSDHFVGDYYVAYDSWSREDPEAEGEARRMLKAWEEGDAEVNDLWLKMNEWAVKGIEETYRKTGVSFDAVYYESNTYKRGREEVLKGLEEGVFYREEDGSVWVDLSDIDLDKKVLLRSDGTSLYLTQDIGTAIARYDDWPFNSLVYVVASEQSYHFKVLFHVLKKLGFTWAENLYHLSYGMVNLPEGKMKSREGTVVDADELFEELRTMAAGEIENKERIDHVGDVDAAAGSVALAALNYYLLQVSPSKDMIFDPKESISFNGNTGPYLQYMGARISSMLRKYEERKDTLGDGEFDPALLTVTEERELIKLLADYPKRVEKAGREMNPNILAVFLYDLSKTFSKYYHDNPVLHNDNPNVIRSRIELAAGVVQVLKNAFELVGIPFLERM